jgi:hypothetical protein
MFGHLWGKRGPSAALWVTIVIAGGMIVLWVSLPKPPTSFREIPYGISADELARLLARKYGAEPLIIGQEYYCEAPQRTGSERLYFETLPPSKRFLGVRTVCDSIGFAEAMVGLIPEYGSPDFLDSSDSAQRAWWVWDGDTNSAQFKIRLSGDTLSHTAYYRNATAGGK